MQKKDIRKAKTNDEYIEIETRRAIVELPSHAVEVDIEAKIYENGEIIKVSTHMGMEEIQSVFQKADNGYIDDEDTFVITEKGRRELYGEE